MSLAATSALLIAVGSCCLCGGLFYYQWPHFESDPEAAATLTRQMLPVRVPESFTPEGTIEWSFWMLLQMRGAYFVLRDGDGELSFLEVDSRFIDNAEFRNHIRQSLREHGAGGGYDLAVRESQTKTYDIAGQSVTFQFLQADDRTTGAQRRLVDGIVEGTNGPVMISLWVDEESWDPEMVERLIESIGSQPPATETEQQE